MSRHRDKDPTRAPRTRSLGDLLATPSSKLSHGHSWGYWRLDAVRLCLLFEPPHPDGGVFVFYEVDLETCQRSSSVLDWICQISGKGWDERWPGCTENFVKAIRDIIDPQAKLCSFAIRGGPRDDRYIPQKEMKAVLRERIAEPSEAEKERTWAWAYGSESALTPWLGDDRRNDSRHEGVPE